MGTVGNADAVAVENGGAVSVVGVDGVEGCCGVSRLKDPVVGVILICISVEKVVYMEVEADGDSDGPGAVFM